MRDPDLLNCTCLIWCDELFVDRVHRLYVHIYYVFIRWLMIVIIIIKKQKIVERELMIYVTIVLQENINIYDYLFEKKIYRFNPSD